MNTHTNFKKMDDTRLNQIDILLKTIWSFYNEPSHLHIPDDIRLENGNETSILHIADRLNMEISKVSQKAHILIIGNSSVGKSTFINWFVNNAVQKTGMATETNKITVITSGAIATELTSSMLIHLSPFFQELLESNKSLDKYLTTKVIPNTSKILQFINFIDTPSLSDINLTKDLNFPQVISHLSEFSDLILVFLDHRDASVDKSSFKIIKNLYEIHPNKIRFCLTKFDDIPTEEERLKIISQVTQSLVTYVTMRPGLDLIPIYIQRAKFGHYLLPHLPIRNDLIAHKTSNLSTEDSISNMAGYPQPPLINRLNEVCEEINEILDIKTQNSFIKLRADCNLLHNAAESDMQKYIDEYKQNKFNKERSHRVYKILPLIFYFVINLLIIGYNYYGWFKTMFDLPIDINLWFDEYFSLNNRIKFGYTMWSLFILTLPIILFTRTHTFNKNSSKNEIELKVKIRSLKYDLRMLENFQKFGKNLELEYLFNGNSKMKGVLPTNEYDENQ